ncbi:MAG TPA: outer membrane lipoprotein carrier protein LolA [Deltaproteobacteria bacterium]|nr:outer membrane lipoprotein carrier protein LolA [Deltaproteobacteria bacterium]
MALKWKNSLIILIFAVCAASPLYAENLKNIQQFYKDYQDFTVNFTQNTFQSLVNKEIRFTGTVSYKRGVGVRMDVFKPQRQIIILKGQEVVIHIPEEDTTTVQALPPEMANQNILGFFSGLESIGDGYEVQESSDALFLYPRQGSGHITVWTDDSHAIKRILLKDATGNQSDIRLSNYRFDTGIPENLFHLEGEEDAVTQPPAPTEPALPVR